MAYGWRLKPFHKMILLSQAYQQQSGFRDEPAGIDSENTLLWRFSPRRLSAEEIRDTMLSSAGLLDQRMGGQGFRLYRYLQDNVATYVPLDQHGPSTWRRAVYHHQARASVVDLMSEFDCPDPAFASPRRATTTTPLQALTLMNHTFTMDMASAMAQRLDREAGSNLTHWIQRAFLMTQGRLPDTEEIKKVASFKQAMGGQLVCRALFNANAFIHLD
jgi:arylamine N-acetyltransferase